MAPSRRADHCALISEMRASRRDQNGAAESLRVDKSKEDDDAWRRGRSAAVDARVAKL